MSAATTERAPAATSIRMDIVDRLNASGGLPHALINIDVHGGVVVEPRGVVPSDANRNTLCALALRTRGVTPCTII